MKVILSVSGKASHVFEYIRKLAETKGNMTVAELEMKQ